jgi:hypothetical protein
MLGALNTRVITSAHFVADLFEFTSPRAETSPDAGRKKDGPLLCSTIAARSFSSDGKTIDARAVALVLCAA